METGIDDLDDYVNGSVNDVEENAITQNITSPDDSVVDQTDVDTNTDTDSADIISELLKLKGIADSSKIKFENEDGDIEEVSWDSLSDQDKLHILSSDDKSTDESDLDETEIQLINAIRESKMSPEEYISYIQQQGINNYLQNQQSSYQVDDLSDEELFIADLISKVGEDNISDDEIQSALDTAKQNEAVFKKQIAAIRNEYKNLEDQNVRQTQEMERQQQIESFNKFAESIENEIRAFKDIQGFELNMDESEMEELYDFITGFDDAGVSIFSKVLNNPKTLVQMAWFALHGEEALQDINDYYTKEITSVRKNSYKQGAEDYKNGKFTKKSNVEIRPVNNKSNSSDDLDDF